MREKVDRADFADMSLKMAQILQEIERDDDDDEDLA